VGFILIIDTFKNVEYLNNLYKDIWWNSSTELKLNSQTYSYWEKKKKENQFNFFTDTIINHIEKFPKEESNQLQWKKQGDLFIENFILKEDTFKLGVMDKKMKDDFFKATNKFIRECKKFDEKLEYQDIGQALRNVWIVNIFQKVLDNPIEFTNAIFGYSMLYPYTDNHIDDTSIPMEHKKCFNDRFSKKLRGEFIQAMNPHEEKVYKLVDYIETVFNREEYSEIYNKLLLIHEGQKKSLTQQDVVSIPYERDMLSISIEKGGASVLADGYLINGTLTKDEEIFAYGYGFLLQLCDDLQDLKTDLKNNHMTIMSQLAERYPLDILTNKLINLTTEVIDNAQCFKGSNVKELKELIKNNCITMILFAIVDNKEHFTKKYIKSIEVFLPFTLNYISKINERLQKKFKVLKSSYHEISIEDIVLHLIQ
jgi:hypothetical protein